MSTETAPQSMTLRLLASPAAPEPAKLTESKQKPVPEPVSVPKPKPLARQAAVEKPKLTPAKVTAAKPQVTEVKNVPKPEPTPDAHSPQAVPETPVPDAQADTARVTESSVTDAVSAQEAAKPVLLETPSFRVKPMAPRYPRAAKRKGQEGVVLVEIWLDAQGRQTRTEVVESSGFLSLDQAALTAVQQWQFRGYQRDGQTLASRFRVPVRFELK